MELAQLRLVGQSTLPGFKREPRGGDFYFFLFLQIHFIYIFSLLQSVGYNIVLI